MLKPVLAVGLLAAAWKQERGGAPRDRAPVPGIPRQPVGAAGDRRVLRRRASRSRVSLSSLVDGGKLLEFMAQRRLAHRRAARGRARRRPAAARHARSRRCFALPVVIADLVGARARRVPGRGRRGVAWRKPARGARELEGARRLRARRVLLLAASCPRSFIALVAMLVPPPAVVAARDRAARCRIRCSSPRRCTSRTT